MIQLYNLIDGKYSVLDEGGFLVTQDRILSYDADNVDVNVKANSPDTSDAYDGSNMDSLKINVKRGIVNLTAIVVSLSCRMYFRQ